MASDAHVILVDPAPGAADHARRRLEELEQRWSRFLPQSDISRLNTAPEALLVVSPDTVALVSAMKEAWRLTNGGYDPTMLAAIIAAGYATSIDGSSRTGLPATRSCGRGTIADVLVEPAPATVLVPAGMGLDPGGIGKGLAADRVVVELLGGGTAGALVTVGGDLAAAGTPPTTEGWYVAVEHPLDASRTLVTLALNAGGMATSSTLSRTWMHAGHRRHHALDPATQTCSATDLAAVTVAARAGWQAEAHATAALLCGSQRVLDYFGTHRLAGLATTLDGVTTMSPGLKAAGVAQGSAA